MHDSQQVMAMRYAFISNHALRAISATRKGRKMAARGPEALRLSADFLLEMRRGVAFARDSRTELGYSAESLPAATRAFGVIETLALASRVSEVDTLLEAFESKLRALALGQQLAPARLETIERFFRALNQSLTEEVAQATLGSTLEGGEHVGA